MRTCLLAALCLALTPSYRASAGEKVAFPFKKGDRIAWIGSSSTNIGIWPKTMDFLLRTRHPELGLAFTKHSTGGGSFATGLQNLDKWLADSKPTVVFFNYGSNDAGADAKGLPRFKEAIVRCVAKVEASGARVVFMTPQAADVRKAGSVPATRRKLYADALLAIGKEKRWPVIDVHTPLHLLQVRGQEEDETYTILRDNIHLTDAAYVAWGYFLYERLSPPAAISAVALSADGKVQETTRCKIVEVKASKDSLTFVRADEILPLLPHAPLPSRRFVPLEKYSDYRLKVTGLADGKYEVRCEGKLLGVCDARTLQQGLNLNALILAQPKAVAPWDALVRQIWAGKDLEQIGKTRWRFEVSRTTS